MVRGVQHLTACPIWAHSTRVRCTDETQGDAAMDEVLLGITKAATLTFVVAGCCRWGYG